MKKYLNNEGERVLTEQEFDELVKHLIETGQAGSNKRHIKKTEATPTQYAGRRAYRLKTREKENARQNELRKANPDKTRERYDKANAKRRTPEERAKRQATRDKEAANKYNRELRAKNPDLARQKERERYAQNREDIVEYKRKYREDNPEQVKKTQKRSYKKKRQDPAEVMFMSIRARFYDMVTASGNTKHRSAREFGLETAQDLQDYIEGLWLLGMSWDNYGKGEDMWEVDHIMPCRGEGVDMNNPAHQYAIWNYRNFQPLWREDNISKFNKIAPEARALFDELVSEFERGEAA